MELLIEQPARLQKEGLSIKDEHVGKRMSWEYCLISQHLPGRNNICCIF
jgi:hypothetical protein